MDPNRIPLPHSSREIAPLIEGPPPPYGRIYRAHLDARIPTEQVGNRVFILRADLPKVIAALGLTPKPVAAPPKRQRKAPSADLVAA